MPKHGKKYRAANGTGIREFGQADLKGRSRKAAGLDCRLPVKVAEVTKSLGSVMKMVKAGNKVVFDLNAKEVEGMGCEGGYIQNKKTKKVVPIKIYGKQGREQFGFDMWIQKTGKKVEEDNKKLKDKDEMVIGNVEKGFHRQDIEKAI